MSKLIRVGKFNEVPTDVEGINSQIKDLDRILQTSEPSRYTKIFTERKEFLKQQRKNKVRIV